MDLNIIKKYLEMIYIYIIRTLVFSTVGGLKPGLKPDLEWVLWSYEPGITLSRGQSHDCLLYLQIMFVFCKMYLKNTYVKCIISPSIL